MGAAGGGLVQGSPFTITAMLVDGKPWSGHARRAQRLPPVEELRATALDGGLAEHGSPDVVGRTDTS